MAAVAPYTTGTATVTSGSAVVTGAGTAWNIGVVNGGVFFRNGLGLPILSVDSATQLTLALPAPAGMAGAGVAYAIDLARAGAADAVTANARLAQLVAQLQGISAFSQTFLDDADAATVRATIGAVAGSGSYTAADVLAKLLTVDTDAAGINATTVKSTVPLSVGLGVLNSDTTLSAQQSLGFKPLTALTIDDDTLGAYNGSSLPGMTLGGLLFIFGNTISAGHGLLYLRTGGSSFQLSQIAGVGLHVQSGVVGSVANTTDGMLGVALDTTGILRIINRTGATRSFYYVTMQGS